MIYVVMSTYFPAGDLGDIRLGYAERCAMALADQLYGDELALVVADDGSPDSVYPRSVAPVTGRFADRTRVVTGPRAGIGASLNRALATLPNDALWLYTTDDWLLTEDLDLTPAIKLIRNHGYCYVRLLPTHPNLQCVTRFGDDVGWWLDIKPELGGYVFATRPFLATREFWRTIGPFDEGLNAYDTERRYAERVTAYARQHLINLAQLVDLHGPWRHIGDAQVGTLAVTP